MRCKIRLAGVAVTLSLLLFLSPCDAASDADPAGSSAQPITLAEYTQELSRIDQQLKALVEHPEGAADLRAYIPDEWNIKTDTAIFHIDNHDLLYRLDRYTDTAKDRSEILPKLEYQVEALLDGAKEFERPAEADARSKLESILQGREYRDLTRTQSPLETLKDRLLAWVMDFLSKIFRSVSAHPRASEILIWTIIGSITLSFVVWMYFLLRRSARDEYKYPAGDATIFPSSKPWQQWLRDANSAAERGDWREAVHLAYWCSISYLESAGVWKPDRARTPREYLRTYKPQSGAGQRKEPLEALTRRFESIWYAQQAAAPEDFQFSLAQLDKIGCR